MIRILALVMLAVAVDARADIWTDCVLYNRAHPQAARMFAQESTEPGAVVVDALEAFWTPAQIAAHEENGDDFIGVCRNVAAYTLPALPDHCVFRNPDYRFDRAAQRWTWDAGWNPDGVGERQCWFEAGWKHRLGYWGRSGTPEAGEWIAYPHPCADYQQRMEAGEHMRPEPSCEPYLWGGE